MVDHNKNDHSNKLSFINKGREMDLYKILLVNQRPCHVFFKY